MSLSRLLALVDGLEHSCPEGREDADAIRNLMSEREALAEALGALAAFDGNGSGGLLDYQAEGSELGFQSAALTAALDRARVLTGGRGYGW